MRSQFSIVFGCQIAEDPPSPSHRRSGGTRWEAHGSRHEQFPGTVLKPFLLEPPRVRDHREKRLFSFPDLLNKKIHGLSRPLSGTCRRGGHEQVLPQWLDRQGRLFHWLPGPCAPSFEGGKCTTRCSAGQGCRHSLASPIAMDEVYALQSWSRLLHPTSGLPSLPSSAAPMFSLRDIVIHMFKTNSLGVPSTLVSDGNCGRSARNRCEEIALSFHKDMFFLCFVRCAGETHMRARRMFTGSHIGHFRWPPGLL